MKKIKSKKVTTSILNIWKKKTDGNWMVNVDVGKNSPGVEEYISFFYLLFNLILIFADWHYEIN
jgi:hypothetical protein